MKMILTEMATAEKNKKHLIGVTENTNENFRNVKFPTNSILLEKDFIQIPTKTLLKKQFKQAGEPGRLDVVETNWTILK